MQRRERPHKRVYPSGKTVWQAQPRDNTGRRHNLGTFKKQGPCRDPGTGCCAQHAIDAFYVKLEETPAGVGITVGHYAERWTTLHPRSERTNSSNLSRVNSVLDFKIDGRALRDWAFADVSRRHANLIFDHLLRDQGRAAKGARGVMTALSAMARDAADDEVITGNPFAGLKMRANDPRVTKAPREAVLWTFEQMHAFAAAAAGVKTVTRSGGRPSQCGRCGDCARCRQAAYARASYERQRPAPALRTTIDDWRPIYAEPMIRMLSDCGLRLGEMLALKRASQDFKHGVFVVEGSAWNGKIVPSSPQKNHDRSGPIPPSTLKLLVALPPRIDSPWLFPTPTGKLWRESMFRRDVWNPAQRASGLNCLPHDMRHSWVSLLTASPDIDDADLALIAGHSVAVQQGVYRHALGKSYDAVREAIG